MGEARWAYEDASATLVDKMKLLGYWLDERLRPVVHVWAVTGKAEARLAEMRAAFGRTNCYLPTACGGARRCYRNGTTHRI